MQNKDILNELKNYHKNHLQADKQGTTEACSRLKITNRSIFTYGSTPYSTFENLYNNITKKPKRFIVVGSSIGWVNFYWNDIFPNIPTIGLDIHDVRIKFAKDLIDKYNLKNISFLNKDWKDFEFKDEDLIWQSNTCFEQKNVEEVNDSILQKKLNISIISYRHITSNREIRKITKRLTFPTSWSKSQYFYIYENK